MSVLAYKKVFRPFSVCIIIMLWFSVSLNAQVNEIHNDMAKEILLYINHHRVNMGLQLLKMNDIMSLAAENHSTDMAKGKIPFGHAGFNERMGNIKMQLKHINAWAENVAYGANTAREVVDMWLHSPEHKKNIEGNYNMTGIGIAKSRDGSLYFTQIFMNKE